MFLDPVTKNIDACKELGVNAIEFHTGEIANAFGEKEKSLINQLKNVIEYAVTRGISIRAGHGLNFDKTKKIIKIKYLEELKKQNTKVLKTSLEENNQVNSNIIFFPFNKRKTTLFRAVT